jgi:hypothetical protein
MTTIDDSLYKVLYTYPNQKQFIVLDGISGRIYVKKVLDIYAIEVFEHLSRHHNIHIPAVKAFYEVNNKLTVIEEFISGQTLSEYLKEKIPNDDEKREILKQLLEGISFLHSAEPPIIHRDLKTDNIMITDDGILKVIDYNAAKIPDPSEKRDTVLIGTEGSAAPEQYGFAQSDCRTDIYALGIMLRKLFPEDAYMNRVADKATRMDPKDRYATVEELQKACFRQMDIKQKPSSGINIPGFRTGNIGHMIAAVCGYAFLLYMCVTMQITSETGIVMTGAYANIEKAAIMLVFLSIIDLFTHWSHFFDRIPQLKSDSRSVRVLSYTCVIFLIFVFWAMIGVIAQSIAVKV